MRGLRIFGMVLAALLAAAGLMTANGITANVIAGCACLSDSCIQACGPQASEQCCTTQSGGLKQVQYFPSSAGYTASLIGMTGFFVLLGMGKKEEDMY
jgi:hypothetical protein